MLCMTLSLRDHDLPARGARWTLFTVRARFIGLALYLVTTTAISAERKDDLYVQFEKCRVLGDDQARLTCLKNLIPKDEPSTSTAADSWPLVRTPHPRGGPDAVS